MKSMMIQPLGFLIIDDHDQTTDFFITQKNQSHTNNKNVKFVSSPKKWENNNPATMINHAISDSPQKSL